MRTFLLIAIGVVSVITTAMTGIVVFKGTLGASIGDTLGDPSVSPNSYPVASVRPQALTNNPAVSLVTGPIGDTVRYYEKQTGHTFQVDLVSRKITILSDRTLAGFMRTIWSADRQSVISIFSKTSGTVFTYFDFVSGKSAVLPTNTVSAVFAPDGRHIALVRSDPDQKTIARANPDGTETQTLLNSRASDIHLSWPRSDLLVMESQGVSGSGVSLTAIGDDGALIPILSQMENLEYQWSRDGKKLLYSYYDKKVGTWLWYRDTETGILTPLDLATSARKCAWHPDSVTVTCGVPSNTGLARDVSADQSATVDDMVTIDISTGVQTEVMKADPESYIGVIDPIISPSGKYFIFLNLFDQKVYSLPLTQ